MRDVRLPFRQSWAPAEMGSWQLKVGESFIELPEEHPHWDPTVDLEVSRKVVVDGARLLADTALGTGAHVRLLAGWHSENGRSRHFPWRTDLQLPTPFEGTIELRIPATEIATSVDLIVGAVLVAPSRQKQSLVAATVPGSWLWRDETELRLEATRGRFPMEWTDFKPSGLPPEAPWYLDWPSQDWSAPLLGALRLRLNATNAFMRDILELPEADPKRMIVIQSAILDVAKQLVVSALGSDEFVEQHATFPEGSVGFCVRHLIRMPFPNESMKTLQSRLRDHAGDFHVALQAGVVPFKAIPG